MDTIGCHKQMGEQMKLSTHMDNKIDVGIMFRIYTVFVGFLYGFVALLQPETLIYQVAHADAFSKIVMFGLCAFAILGALDVTINDLLPERFVYKTMLKDRHLISMAITLCFAVQMWSSVKHGMPNTFLPFYGIQIILIPVAAFYDIHKRFAKK